MNSYKRKKYPQGPRPGEKPGRLRRGVGMVVLNHAGLVLAGLRRHADGSAAWQLPQGGIEGAELPLTAAYRELEEETSLTPDQVTLIEENPRWTVYRLPDTWARQTRFAGQRQRWFLFRYLGDDLPSISKALHEEFKELKWVPFEVLLQEVIAFRKPVYQRILQAFGRYFAEGVSVDVGAKASVPSDRL